MFFSEQNDLIIIAKLNNIFISGGRKSYMNIYFVFHVLVAYNRVGRIREFIKTTSEESLKISFRFKIKALKERHFSMESNWPMLTAGSRSISV